MKKSPNWLWKNKIYVIIVLIIVAAIGYYGYKKAHVQPSYITDTVTKGTVSDTVSESGNLITEGQANIYSPIDGVVTDIAVSNGDSVQQGQPLFSVASLATDQDRASANANLLATQTSLASAEQSQIALGALLDSAKQAVFNAQNNDNTVSKGYKKQSINPATGKDYKYLELESADAALSAAHANLNAAQTSYDNATKAIDSATAAEQASQLVYDGKSSLVVKAPDTGMVSNLSVTIGDKVSATGAAVSSVSAPSPVLILSKSSTLVFKAQINEIDIAKLQVGQAATVAIDALKDKPLTGKIEKIDQIGTDSQGVISYNVYFSLDNPDTTLRSAMSGSVDVVTQEHDNVLTVANAAVKPYQGGKAVQILQDQANGDKTKKVLTYIPVTVGLRGLERTEILSGLTEGQVVILSPASTTSTSSTLTGGN
jgi:macrolide-specific efflux system membrane fusion protein